MNIHLILCWQLVGESHVFIHPIGINVKRLEVAQGQSCFVGTWILTNNRLISLYSHFRLILLVVEQCTLHGGSAPHWMIRETLCQLPEGCCSSVRLIKLHIR